MSEKIKSEANDTAEICTEDLRKQFDEDLRIFHDIGKTLTSTLNLNEILSIIMENVSKLLRPKNWSLLMVDEKSNELFFEIAVGEGSEKIKGLRLKIGEGVAGFVAKTGESLLIPNVYEDPRWTRKVDSVSKFKTKSIICVPLMSKGKVLGVIELINKLEEPTFDNSDMTLLNTLADYAAIAIENSRFLQQVKALTITDDVTDLYNSRYLQSRLKEEVERSRRYSQKFSLIFLDLDHFKNVNDSYGHLIGSRVLREVGGILKESIRQIDNAFRYGGDEFVVLLPQTDKEGALAVAEKMREQLNDFEFVEDMDLELHLTASYGVATFPTDADSVVDLLRLADRAMYFVKEHGRDNIEGASKK
jgi:diguanylate cyclase (GGDEF)-like protein